MTSSAQQRYCEFVRELKANLPEFALLPKPELWSPSLQQYFSLYGFKQLAHCAAAHEFGRVDVGAYRLACHRWTVADARAEVTICHGLYDHVGLYLPLIKFLLEQKLNVLAFDLPEHGLSSGVFGELDDFALYRQALRGLITQLPCTELPRIALGQSTGAAVLAASELEPDTPASFAALILLAPLLRIHAWRQICLAQRYLAPWLKKLRRSFTVNSHDGAFVEFLRDYDPLQPNYISTNWTGAMVRWERGFDDLAQSAVPALIVQGTADNTVDYAYNLPQWQKKLERCELLMLEGARHHLVGEARQWRTPMFAAIATFINAQLEQLALLDV